MARRPTLRLLLCAGLLLAGTGAVASGLQVAPVSLTLQPVQHADGLWLSNTGTDLVHAQVRVYRWTQVGGADQLTASQELVISPPMLGIGPGDRQLIRVIRIGAPPSGSDAVEAAYRLAIDELPVKDSDRKGLQFVLHYSVPVFVEPQGGKDVAPDLHWTLQREGDHAALVVSNTGTGHAQLAGISYLDHAGHRKEIAGGLLGYVLPGATMHWTLKQPATDFTGTGTLEATINGAKATQTISLADRAR
jgi:fimbrial chaperone protein